MTVAGVAASAGRNQVPLGIAYTVGSTVMFAGVASISQPRQFAVSSALRVGG